MLVLSQLSRAVEQRTPAIPKLSDLRESGAIEQDADVVMMIYREDKNTENSLNPNIAKIMIEKHRNGPTGSVQLYFDQNKSSFLSMEKNAGDFGDFFKQRLEHFPRVVRSSRHQTWSVQSAFLSSGYTHSDKVKAVFL